MKNAQLEKAKFQRNNRTKIYKLFAKYCNNIPLTIMDFNGIIFKTSEFERYERYNDIERRKVFQFLYTYMFEKPYIPLTKKTFSLIKNWYRIYVMTRYVQILDSSDEVLNYNANFPFKKIHNSITDSNWIAFILQNTNINVEQEQSLLKNNYDEIVDYNKDTVKYIYNLLHNENKEWYKKAVLFTKALM